MFGHVIIEFPGQKEKVSLDDITQYDGEGNVTEIVSLETVVDCSELTLSFLGEMFPNLEKLRLNNSIMTSVRDIGCTLKNLRFLNLARCGLTSLDGLGALSGNLVELYVAYNKITDVFDLLGMEKLEIVDLESNLIENLDDVEVLKTSPKITALTLAGNPAANVSNYRERVAELLPNLVYLDEKRVKSKKSSKLGISSDRTMTKSQSLEIKVKKPQVVKFSDDIVMDSTPKSFTKFKQNDEKPNKEETIQNEGKVSIDDSSENKDANSTDIVHKDNDLSQQNNDQKHIDEFTSQDKQQGIHEITVDSQSCNDINQNDITHHIKENETKDKTENRCSASQDKKQNENKQNSSQVSSTNDTTPQASTNVPKMEELTSSTNLYLHKYSHISSSTMHFLGSNPYPMPSGPRLSQSMDTFNDDQSIQTTSASLSNMNEEILMTEQLRDKVDDRPISSLGSKTADKNAFRGFFANMPDKIPTSSHRNSLSMNKKSKIIRPISAKGRSFI